MGYRGRKVAALAVALVILGFVLNIIAGKTSTTARTSAATPAVQAPRPVAPLYVPRPASLIMAMYGAGLTADSSPQDVAKHSRSPTTSTTLRKSLRRC